MRASIQQPDPNTSNGAVNANQVGATTWANAVDHPFYIIFDLAMGGGFPSAFGGGRNGATLSGGQMNVDYVAVYSKGPGSGGSSGGTGPGTSGVAGKCLDDFAGASANGTKADLWDCNSTPAQQRTSNGSTFPINGKCLDHPGFATATASGTELDTWGCKGGPNQQWS